MATLRMRQLYERVGNLYDESIVDLLWKLLFTFEDTLELTKKYVKSVKDEVEMLREMVDILKRAREKSTAKGMMSMKAPKAKKGKSMVKAKHAKKKNR